jgi:hypothetical protein
VAEALAEEEIVAQADFLAEAGTGLAAHHGRLDLRQVAFLVIGKSLEKHLAGDEPQDAIAQELEPFV